MIFWTIITGMITGTSSGLFGIGGAMIGTPLLKLFVGLSPMLALATPLPAAFPASVSGSWNYYKAGLIQLRVAKYILLGGIPSAFVGSMLTQYVEGNFMMLLTAVFLSLVGGTFFVRGWILQEKTEAMKKLSVTQLLISGCASGFLAGFLAIGGGVVMIPVFVQFVRMNIKQAFATSLFCVAILAIPGIIGHAYLGHIHWQTALILSFVSIPASFLGSRLAIRARSQQLERLYGTFMIIFAAYFFFINL